MSGLRVLDRAPVVLSALFAVALLAVASLAGLRFDATAGARHTPAPALLELLDASRGDGPVEAYAVFSSSLPPAYRGLARDADDLLDALARRRDIDVHRVDPAAGERDARLARELGVVEGAVPGVGAGVPLRAAASLVLRQGDRTLARVDQLVPGQPLQVALAYDLAARQRETAPVVGVVIGVGGTFDQLAADADDLGPVLRAIEAQVLGGRYRLEPIELNDLGREEVDGVLLLGPTRPLATEEAEALSVFVQRGGAAAVLVDPFRRTDSAEGPQVEPNELGLAEVFASWGIERVHGALTDDERSLLSVRYAMMPGEGAVPVEVPTVAPDPRLPLMTELASDHAVVADLALLAFSPVDRRRPAPVGALEVDAPARVLVASSPSAVLRRPGEGAAPPASHATVAVIEGGDLGGRVLVAASSGVIAQLFVQQDPLRNPALLDGQANEGARRAVAAYADSQMRFFENLADWLVASPQLATLRAHEAPAVVRARELSDGERAWFLLRSIGAPIAVLAAFAAAVAALRRRQRRQIVARLSS